VARPEVARVVGVYTVRHRREAEIPRNAAEHREELGLAVVATVGAVRAIVGVFHLPRGHEAMLEPEVARDAFGHRSMRRGIRG
jgi:hypothetical protein